MTSIYILSDSINIGRYKVGSHTGTLNKLKSRYITSIPSLVVNYFIETDNAKTIETQFKQKHINERILNSKGRISEWVNMELHEIIGSLLTLLQTNSNRANETTIITQNKNKFIIPEIVNHQVIDTTIIFQNKNMAIKPEILNCQVDEITMIPQNESKIVNHQVIEMQEIQLSSIQNCPLIGVNPDGTLIHIMAVQSYDGIKLYQRDPTLYPDNERISKATQSVSFQYSEEAKRYKYLQDIGTSLKTAFWDCKTEEEKQLLILSQNPNIAQTMLESLDAQIQYLRNSGIKYKQSKTKCSTDNERMLLSLNTQRINMKNKIARCMTEIPIIPEYSFMEAYSRLNIMTQAVYFEGTKLLNNLRQLAKYDNSNNLIKYVLSPEAQSVYNIILKMEDKIQLASSSEHELIICLKEWESNIKYTAPIIEIITLPKELKYNTYWCSNCNDSITITIENNIINDNIVPKCKLCNKLTELS